jgi:hypothetical protein
VSRGGTGDEGLARGGDEPEDSNHCASSDYS